MGEFKTPEQIATAESALEKCRSSTDVQRVYFEHYLQACGVGIASATENAIDTSTPSGRAMFQISGTFAELEVATITERMKMGIVERVKSGRMYRASTAP